jgi:hypothetical protein
LLESTLSGYRVAAFISLCDAINLYVDREQFFRSLDLENAEGFATRRRPFFEWVIRFVLQEYAESED